jgi:hypothetical protein
MHHYSKRIDECVERLCNKGCRAVWGDIASLEQGRVLEETRHLNPDEIVLLVAELKEIMAVYEGSCSID